MVVARPPLLGCTRSSFCRFERVMPYTSHCPSGERGVRWAVSCSQRPYSCGSTGRGCCAALAESHTRLKATMHDLARKIRGVTGDPARGRHYGLVDAIGA